MHLSDLRACLGVRGIWLGGWLTNLSVLVATLGVRAKR